MRSLFHCFLLLCLTISLSFCGTDAKKSNSPNKDDLLKTVAVFNSAFAEGDLATLDSLTTENYIHSNGNSKAIDKTAWFAYLKKRTAKIKSGELEVISYQLDDTKIEMHQNTAILTGKISVTNKNSSQITENQYRVTNIWVNESGIWKRAAFHDGKIK